jgi:lysophospholipid acyltransferase (LPLAT)-like uncharacterized protein
MKEFVASGMLRAVASTWRMHIHGTLPQAPCIVAFWHAEMLPVWYAMRKLHPVALVSNSKDGNYLAHLLADWGYSVIRGSSSKGGGEALYTMIDQARSGRIVMVTPDGPRGPAHVFKPGAVVAAQRAGVPLVLMRAYSQRAKIFDRSWDKFQFPQPLSHITLHVSHAQHVAPDADRELIDSTIHTMQEKLNNLGSITC